MIEFSVDKYNIQVCIGQKPNILDYYKKHAGFIDDTDLRNEGTEVYIIISKGYQKPDYSIIAFRTQPVGYAGFHPGLYYERKSETLFIGAGTLIKTYRLTDNKLIFEKDHGYGFWGWAKHQDFIIQQEETAVGIFNLRGEQLWETFVGPPYDFKIEDGNVILKFDDIIESRDILTGAKIKVAPRLVNMQWLVSNPQTRNR